MIEVKNLQKTYRSHGQTVGLLGADFTVPDGQIVGVLGENGAGKTTLLRCIAGLLPHKGTALLDGRPAGEQYGCISYITGEGSYYPALTVAAYGQLLADLHPAFDPARYEKFLEFFSLHGSDVIGHLSTGQRARVELAAGFAKRVPYYLMDEPFLGKDPLYRGRGPFPRPCADFAQRPRCRGTAAGYSDPRRHPVKPHGRRLPLGPQTVLGV